MTEEIEKQAEEYADNKYYCNRLECIQGNSCDYCYYGECKQAFKDGAKWGMEHEWHDIESYVLPKREISKKYMPKANEKVMLKYHFYNETEIHYSDGYYDMFDFEFHIPNNPTGRIICVIAWCELPQFKE